MVKQSTKRGSMEFLAANIDVGDFGKRLARASDTEQALIINKLAYELKVLCRDENLDGIQMCAISDKLDHNGRAFVKSLAEFVEIRKNNESRD